MQPDLSLARVIAIVAATGIAVMGGAAFAQAATPVSSNAPNYGSGYGAGSFSGEGYDTPEADGRPGVKFFAYGAEAYRKGDMKHAVDMYKLAAYWAYAPAAYNLGVMYFKGQGVPVDRPLGAAWMVIAAQQGNRAYGVVRDQMVSLLTDAEFHAADQWFGKLEPKYGEKVAMRRAKAQWAFAKSQKTGSRVGGEAGELLVGTLNAGSTPAARGKMGKMIGRTTTAFGLMQAGSVPGAVAYRQFQESSNPYSTQFLRNRKGEATVGPLREIPAERASGRRIGLPAAASSTGNSGSPAASSTPSGNPQ